MRKNRYTKKILDRLWGDGYTIASKLRFWLAYIQYGFPLADYLGRKAETIALLPLAIILYPASLALLRSRIHIWPIYSERLGHQCLESDCAIRSSTSSFTPRKILLISRKRKTANSMFFTFLPKGAQHFEGRIVYAAAVALTYFNLYQKAKRFCRVPTISQTHHIIIKDTPIAFRMNNENRKKAIALLGELISCSKLPQEYRNYKGYCAVNFRHPYEEILSLGYMREAGIIPVLAGSPPSQYMAGLPEDLFVNYAASKWKSDKNDVLLSGNAAFCLGSTSGLTLLSSVFGVPSIVHNQVPYREYWYTSMDIVVPKLMRDKESGKLVSYNKEAIDSELKRRYMIDITDACNYEECAAEDILEAVREMCLRLGIVDNSPGDAADIYQGSAISTSFKRKYAAYLPD
jgi:putative glycosyltransferase (TIGR04372 family)